jgi:hypothetical protein
MASINAADEVRACLFNARLLIQQLTDASAPVEEPAASGESMETYEHRFLNWKSSNRRKWETAVKDGKAIAKIIEVTEGCSKGSASKIYQKHSKTSRRHRTARGEQLTEQLQDEIGVVYDQDAELEILIQEQQQDLRNQDGRNAIHADR